MKAFDRFIARKPGETLFYISYRWDDGKKLETYCFMRTEAGAIARTFPLAIACGFGIEPDTHEIDRLSDFETWDTFTVYTNSFQKIKNSRSMSADEKRKWVEAINKELVNGLYMNEDDVKKLGRIVR